MSSPPKSGAAPPPPPPPPPAAANKASAAGPELPVVAPTGPSGAFVVELLIFNGSPFKDHWAYWVRSHGHCQVGVYIHATGDVKNGFKFEVKRNYDLRTTGTIPMKRIPLQWVDAKYFDEKAMFNDGKFKVDNRPVCGFEISAYKVEAPGKTLNTVDDNAAPSGKKIVQRDCQTWIVESADQLVKDHIFSQEVAVYLHTIKQ